MERKIAIMFLMCVLLMWSLLRMAQAAPNVETYITRHYTVAENSPVGTPFGDPITVTSTIEGAILRYSISSRSPDGNLFSIDAETGQLKTAAVFNYETVTYSDPTNGFEIYPTVTEDSDDDGNIDFTHDGFGTVYIKVTDVPEFTEGSSATRQVAENTPTDTPIGTPVSATGGTGSLTYSLTGTDAASFDIVSTSGQLRTKAPLDYEQKNSYTVQVSVRDSSPTPLTDSIPVTINVTNINEASPLVWDDGASATRSVAENTPSRTNIGTPVSATGGAPPLTYSLTGADAASFDIDTNTGQLRTKTTLDYERKKSYIVQVSVMDTTPQTNLITVTINVTDVVETQNPSPPEPTQDPPPEPEKKKVIVVKQPSQCGLGWAPQSQYQHLPELPKVMIYALEFEFTNGNYTCSAIEIRTGDATLSHLEGWQLYLGRLYNPSRLPITLTQENSQFTDQILRLTPESLGQQTFACGTLYLSGQPLPSVQYDLRNENNNQIDRAYSCYFWGQTAVTPERHISPRRISSQALQAMDPPRIERYLLDPTKVFGTYIDFSAFGWDRAVLSDWLLAASEASDIAGGNAPSSPYKQLTTSWAALKLRQTDRRHKRR